MFGGRREAARNGEGHHGQDSGGKNSNGIGAGAAVMLLVERRLAVCVIVYHKPIANVLWTRLEAGEDIFTFQINWTSTTAQQGTLFGAGYKTVRRCAQCLSLVPWMKLFEKLR